MSGPEDSRICHEQRLLDSGFARQFANAFD
jgi:hypothetical protein